MTKDMGKGKVTQIVKGIGTLEFQRRENFLKEVSV